MLAWLEIQLKVVLTLKTQATKEKNYINWTEGLYQNLKLLCIKGCYGQIKKATHIVRENIFKSHIF